MLTRAVMLNSLGQSRAETHRLGSGAVAEVHCLLNHSTSCHKGEGIPFMSCSYHP